jgi:hypothetical protein
MRNIIFVCILLAVGCRAPEGRLDHPVAYSSEEVQGESIPSLLDVRFDPTDWNVKVRNQRDSAMMLGEDFFGITVTTQTGEDIAGGAKMGSVLTN